MKKIFAFIRLMRPHQWVKNVFVFPALVFSKNIFNIDLVSSSLVIFFVFCLVSGFVYSINDIVDAQRDKLHPQKKYRPIPSAQLKKKEAFIFSVILIFAASLICIFYLNLHVLFILFIYILINIIYSFVTKKIFFLDSVFVASGFVLRVLAGSYAISVPASFWIILTTFLCALFIAISKRYNELQVMGDEAIKHRSSISHYSEKTTRYLMYIFAVSAIISYLTYTFNSDFRGMIFTLPFVLLGICRYLFLVLSKKMNENLEVVLQKDRVFLLICILWVCSSLLIVYIL